MKKKIAFINQRYGIEVNGGSEQYTRMIAERLASIYDVEILTTTAIDAVTWKNEYPKGLTKVGPVAVRRFPVRREREPKRFDGMNQLMLEHRLPEDEEAQYIEELGPYSPALVRYVRDHVQDYDVFIVVTYLYYVAVHAMPLVGPKAIFIPTAHDEPYIYLNAYRQVFSAPHSFLFLTDEERFFVQHFFQTEEKPYAVLGVGVDIPPAVDPSDFLHRHGLVQGRFLLYAGRIEAGKECPTLFAHFMRYKQRNPNDVKLVFMGKELTPVPRHADMLSLGFVSEEEKFSGMASALALVMPSQHESLSIVVLEAMSMGTPIIVNNRCEVLRGHCLKSDAGLFYETYEEFEAAVNFLLLQEDAREQMRRNARAYIVRDYQWDHIIRRFSEMIEAVPVTDSPP